MRFQYPRRIEPLVQRLTPGAYSSRTARFSILVGSSLWCNLLSEPTGCSGTTVSVSSSDRASGATQNRGETPLDRALFQYPRRIEPLVQPGSTSPFHVLRMRFSILVGSSLWCNKLVRVEDGYAYVVSVSSSDRASGATRSTWPSSTSTIHVSVSSSDRASGATPPVPPCPRLYPGFQYPRRIEPLVQPTNVPVRSTSIACFSILVGSSLWCNLVAAELDKQQVYVSVSSSDRASGATEGGERWPVLVHLFQYPRRIEPLVQPADR